MVSLLDHDKFTRKGRNLYAEVEIPLDDAVLGAEILAPTLTGQVALNIPPNTPNDRRLRLSGLGMPQLSGNGRRGDLYVSVKVRLPAELSDEEVLLFRRLRELRLEHSGCKERVCRRLAALVEFSRRTSAHPAAAPSLPGRQVRNGE